MISDHSHWTSSDTVAVIAALVTLTGIILTYIKSKKGKDE